MTALPFLLAAVLCAAAATYFLHRTARALRADGNAR